MVRRWEYRTPQGVFRIVRESEDPHCEILFEDEPLGHASYSAEALELLIGGHTTWPSAGDPKNMGLPKTLAEWTFVDEGL